MMKLALVLIFVSVVVAHWRDKRDNPEKLMADLKDVTATLVKVADELSGVRKLADEPKALGYRRRDTAYDDEALDKEDFDEYMNEEDVYLIV